MNNKYQIEKIQIETQDRIRSLAEICFRHTYKTILSPEQMDYMIDWMYGKETMTKELQNQCEYYIIQEKETLKDCGYISIEKKENKCELHKIYVLPTLQKSGIGSFFISFVKDWSLQHQCQSIYLNVNRNNSAQFFYKKMGFEIIRTEDNHIGNGFYMNDYVMELVL